MNDSTRRSTFRVTADALTRIVRDLVLDGSWGRALTTLVEGLHGITHEQAHSILRGDCRLIDTDEGMDIEEHVDSEYQGKLDWFYCSHVYFVAPGHTCASWWCPTGYWKWTQESLSRLYIHWSCSREYSSYKNAVRRKLQDEYCSPGDVIIALDKVIGVPSAAEIVEDTWGVEPKQCIVFGFLTAADHVPPWILQEALKRTPQSAFESALARGKLREFTDDEHEPPSYRPPPVGENVCSRVDRRDSTIADAEPDIGELRRRIIEQAEQGGWIVVGKWKVPRGAFEQWCLYGTVRAAHATPWNPVSESGLKTVGDSEIHTDWVIGAGIDPSDWPLDELVKASEKERYRIQIGLPSDGNVGLVSLTGDHEKLTGIVRHHKPTDRGGPLDIAVLPSLHSRYVRSLQAAAIIAETGGPMAHLAVLAVEKGTPVFLLPRARMLLADGAFVEIEKGRLKIIS